MKKGKIRSGKRGWVITVAVLLGLLFISGVAYALDVAANQGKVPRATAVGGVDISSLDRAAAVAKLDAELGGVENKPVRITAGEKSAELVPAQAGFRMDNQAAVDGIPDASLNPISRVASFFAPLHEVPVSVQVDEAQLNPQLDRVVGELTVAPTDGAVAIEAGKPKVTDPILGQTVERDALTAALRESWLDPEGVKLEPTEVQPAINKDVIKKFVDGDVHTALADDLVVTGREGAKATLDKAAIGELLRVKSDNGALALEVDRGLAQEKLGEQLKGSEVPFANAKLSFAGGGRQVTPHTDGIAVDWDKTLDGFDKRVLSTEKSQRTWEAAYKNTPATFTTEMAQNATFDEVVGEFTTGGYSAASGENIRLTAELVNGAIVGPGETFSLNGYTGPRGAAQGFVESGIIINGHSGKAVGGGISQFATTLYNAAYFAGMEDVAHTPHSYYISRYPAGREATVYEGAIDLQFKNTSNHPVRIETNFGGGNITVRLMGVKTVNVESTNNGRWAPTQPTEMSVPGSACSPSSGAPGFTTSDTRTIRDLSGNVITQETQTTVYDPQPIVRCG